MRIPAPHGHLEARLKQPEEAVRAGAIICHPHPQHGGTLYTKCVYHASKALNEIGVVTLRFNFRGVGSSTGEYDHGLGEREDLRVAMDYFRDRFDDLPLILAGHSFGSYIALSVAAEEKPDGCVGMGLPLEMYDYGFVRELATPTLIVQGTEDSFAPAEEVRQFLENGSGHLTFESVAGSGHLFDGHYDQLRTILQDYFSAGPGSSVLQARVTPPDHGLP